MSDLISRQAAIDVVDSETVSTNPEHFKSSEKFIEFMDDTDIASFGKWQWANGFNTALVATTVQLKNLPSAERWIPVTERLPDESGEYLVTIRSMLYISWFYKDDGVWSFRNADLMAWMPLPTPYKGGEEE